MDLSEEERSKREKYIIRETGGIWPVYEAFYLEAIIYSAGRAKDAFIRFNQALSKSKDPPTIVAIAHEALTHVAGLSRFFWPPGKKDINKARGQKLREVFGLDNTSPLYDRKARNALEHFDERLDEFLLQDLAGYVFPGPVVGSITEINDVLNKMFRFIDPTNEIFILLGEKYSFGPLKKIVDGVLEKAMKMNENGGRFESP